MDKIFTFTKWLKGENTASAGKNRIGFEEILQSLKNRDGIIISTLPFEKQGCLIRGALTVEEEVVEINDLLENGDFHQKIFVYGLNHTDDTVEKKQEQLFLLGFKNVKVYLGGMFEWLLLQDVYGKEQFPTTNKTDVDILGYFVKGNRTITV